MINSVTVGDRIEGNVLQMISVSSGNTPQTHLFESSTAAPLRCVQFLPHHEVFLLSRSF